MADRISRPYAKLYRDIWRDGEWRSLSSHAQGTYFMLLAQPLLTMAGTMPLLLNKWASLSADSDPSSLWDSVSELAEARFIVTDDQTEEVLIRTYMWNDTVRTQRSPMVQVGILRHALKAESRCIRLVLADEVERCLPLFVVTTSSKTEKTFDIRQAAKEVVEVLREPEPRHVSIHVSGHVSEPVSNTWGER